MKVTDGIGLFGTESVSGVSVAYAGAMLTNLSATCSLIQRKANPANATAISLIVATTQKTVTPGAYSMGDNNGTSATLAYLAVNAQCATTANEQATGGTITITQADATTVAGSFDATFANGDHLSGSFDNQVCAVDFNSLSSNAACGM